MSELTPKGVRDFLPQEKILRDKIIETLKYAFEIYGYNPVETPALERYDLLASKYSGGEEILKETFSLVDRGKRKLGLRYDLTVPFARIIAMNPNLKMPFKRYQIDRVWRDGPLKLGRYREFWQADCDVVGSKNLLAEAELLSLAFFVFKNFNMSIDIQVNNRKLLNEVLKFCGVGEELYDSVLLSLDKLQKIGLEGVKKELIDKNINERVIKKLIDIVNVTGENQQIISYIKEKIGKTEGISELEEIMRLCEIFKVKIRIVPTLARGLSYYTGTIFEIYLKDSPITSSVAAGGRFDKMIGMFVGKEEDYPAVGISFGVDVITDAIKLSKNIIPRKSVVDVYVVPIGNVLEDAIPIAQLLRAEGIRTDIDLNSRGVTKNLNFANSYGIKYVIFIGENEIKNKLIKIRDMERGEEKLMEVKDVIKFLRQNNVKF
ncbi:MAG: histidine--tRNA ligase [Candidatus Woesearchaeota archaeon]